MGRGDVVVMAGEGEKRKSGVIMKPAVQHHIILLEGKNPVIVALGNQHRAALPGQPLDGGHSGEVAEMEPLIQPNPQQRQRGKGAVVPPGIGGQGGETAIESGSGNNTADREGFQRTDAVRRITAPGVTVEQQRKGRKLRLAANIPKAGLQIQNMLRQSQ